VLGALCGGFVTGLAGFGTGLTALGFWLHVLEPPVAAALVVICSVVGQAQSLHAVRRAIAWGRAWPFVAGGLVGIPLGVAVLRTVDPRALKVLVGRLLVAYTTATLGFKRWPTVAWGGRLADGVVGVGGGVLGGMAGLSGPLPTIWCGLRGWSGAAQRGVYQLYNLAVLAVVLVVYAAQGLLTMRVLWLALVCLPATVLGAFLGTRLYGRVDDRQFRAIVLWMLFASGLALIVSNLL